MFKFILLTLISMSLSQVTYAEELDTLSDDSSEIESLLDDLEGDRLLNEKSESNGDLAFEDEPSIDEENKLKKKKNRRKKLVSKKRRKTRRPASSSYRKNKLFPSELNNPNKKYTRKKRKIKHPLSKKGLYRITKDLDYLYKTKESDVSKSSSVRFGNFEPTELRNEASQKSFNELYSDASGLIVYFDYEWKKFLFNTIDLKLGSGIFVASGNGQFASTGNQDLIPQEKFTFVMLPNSVSLGYKLDIFDEQWFVPFVDTGLDVFTLIENSDGGGGTKFGASYGAHVAGGGAFSLKFLDRWAAAVMDDEYGINNLWLKIEARQYVMLAGDYDFTGTAINAGFEFDF